MSTDQRAVVRDSLGVGVAVGAYGFAFGAASVAAGLTTLQTCLLSLLAFTGGTQFAVVGVVAGGGSIGAALAGGLLLGARNTLYAMRLAPLLQVRGLRRFAAALGTIDESTAMAVAQPRRPAVARRVLVDVRRGVHVLEPLDAARRAGRLAGRPDRLRAGRGRARPRSWPCWPRGCAAG